jgi:hypothetical protein
MDELSIFRRLRDIPQPQRLVAQVMAALRQAELEGVKPLRYWTDDEIICNLPGSEPTPLSPAPLELPPDELFIAIARGGR